MPVIKKIRVEDLEVGMFVEDFNVPWIDHPFLSNKKLLKSTKDIQILVSCGILEVYINTERGRDSPKAFCTQDSQDNVPALLDPKTVTSASGTSEERQADPLPVETTPFQEEVRRARGIYGQAKALVKDLLQDARMGRSIDGERTARVVDDMVDSIFRNQDALASLSRLKSFDDYTFHHSINVSVLSLTLGRHLGILKGELRRLGIGAILHDVGKMAVPEGILNKPGRLTEEEFAIVKTHALHGARILMQASDVPDECAAVALNHHERFSGRGYPRALQGLAIGKFGLISAITDVYDAITSDRVYHKGMPSYQALQKIYEWARTDFYPIYVQKFIQCLGIYPIGSVVRLDTGEVAVVSRKNPDHLLRPWVRMVRHASGEQFAPVLETDLAEPDPHGERSFRRSIQVVLDAVEAGVDVHAVLGTDANLMAA